MFIRKILMTILALALVSASASAFQGYVQPVGEGGSIAWGNGEMSVVRILAKPGEGQPPLTPLSVRKAASGARKQLLDMVLAVRIDSKRTVSAFLSEDDQLAARVRGVIQNSPLARPAVFEEGGEVRVSETLRGKLAELILPTTIQFQSGIPPKLSTSMEQSLSFEGTQPERVGSSSVGYTGVIFDARGLKVTPAMAPVVYGQDGLGAYGAFLVSRANAVDKGVIGYATTADPAALKGRVGSRPLVVKALSAYGSWRTDLIITTPMARLVRAVMRMGDAVNNCRAVIVLDPMQATTPEAGDKPEEGDGDV
jgi:hypothetical protein